PALLRTYDDSVLLILPEVGESASNEASFRRHLRKCMGPRSATPFGARANLTPHESATSGPRYLLVHGYVLLHDGQRSHSRARCLGRDMSGGRAGVRATPPVLCCRPRGGSRGHTQTGLRVPYPAVGWDRRYCPG